MFIIMEELGIKALSIIIDNLQKWIDMAPAYVQDLFQRYVEFETMWNYFWIIFCVFMLILAICSIIYWCKKDDGWWVIIWWVWTLFMLVAICCCVYELFRLMYVPELYMIDDIISYWCNK